MRDDVNCGKAPTSAVLRSPLPTARVLSWSGEEARKGKGRGREEGAPVRCAAQKKNHFSRSDRKSSMIKIFNG